MDYAAKSLKDLGNFCKEHKIKGYSKFLNNKNKHLLIQLMY